MKSEVETLSPTRVKLTVEVPFEELTPSVDAAYRKVAGQIRIPGFRPGKVPARIVDQRIGRDVVLDEAVNDAIPAVLRAGRRGGGRPGAQPARDRSNKLRGRRAVDVYGGGRRPTRY